MAKYILIQLFTYFNSGRIFLLHLSHHQLQISAVLHVATLAKKTQTDRMLLQRRRMPSIPEQPQNNPTLDQPPTTGRCGMASQNRNTEDSNRMMASTGCCRTDSSKLSEVEENRNGNNNLRETGKNRMDIQEMRGQLIACSSRVLNLWPDTTAIVEKVQQLDPEGLGETFTNLCLELSNNFDTRPRIECVPMRKTIFTYPDDSNKDPLLHPSIDSLLSPPIVLLRSKTPNLSECRDLSTVPSEEESMSTSTGGE